MTELGKKILELKSQGLTQAEISRKLDCSSGTVNYWCNPKENKRAKERVKKRREENPLMGRLEKKIDGFIERRTIDKNDSKKRTKSHRGWTATDALNHLGGQHTKCYLTGRILNLEIDEYELDHIIPYSKSGDYSLNNMGITIPSANRSKYDLTLNEYLDLCKEVLENFGYIIIKE